ncbi:type IVB secretion system protein IcmH/DotU [Motilimonas sp. E26]|uniref:type IVB secretion system protein IcmH/DotU n=1 Tax=Motilimonas TaxID=1914248 RepID=UPI001E3272C6|nr:type IVB secretion system protein IcmH/DotU [Motilimonas sp. E26]MCE0557528.1 type IVB secretion system protein IcmH/DotU [Motilimonas sp. E26]
MDFLDQVTQVKNKQSTQTESAEQGIDEIGHSLILVQDDIGQIEFLRHFDKSENQLLNISSELLGLVLKLSQLPAPDNIAEFRRHLIEQINELKQRGAQLTYPVAVIDKLCFLFAVVLDEFIQYSPWGEESKWENKTLLSELFGMRNGGELFYSVADKALRQPSKLIDLIEIIYLFLSIGFKGQYRDANADQLAIFMHEIELQMHQHRPVTGLRCQLNATLPKVRNPSRRKRYFLTTLFFSGLIITSIGLAHFWYKNTTEQRARDFIGLTNYSPRYIVSGQQNDIIYISTDQDLTSAPKRGSSNTLLDTDWLVQLATFSRRKSALAFTKSLSPSSYQPYVQPYKQYYRVVLRADSKQQANQIKDWYQQHDGVNAMIIQAQNSNNQ